MGVETSHVKELIRQRWNRRAETYDSSPGHGIHSRREKDAWVALFRATLGDGPLNVLDVGTGTGVIALLLAEMGHKVTAVDIADRMIEHARRKAAELALEVDFVVGDAEELPFPDACFDAVVNRHVVWSLPHPEKAVAEWRRVLKPGGKLAIIDSRWGRMLPLRKKLWRLAAQPLIWLSEGKLPGWFDRRYRGVEKHLPMRQRARPAADLALLRSLGFEKVEAVSVDIPRWQTQLGYLKYGYLRGEEFLVRAVRK